MVHCLYIKVAMNRCIKTADTNPKSKDFWIKYQFKVDFTYILLCIETTLPTAN